jgi:hypothetical protein
MIGGFLTLHNHHFYENILFLFRFFVPGVVDNPTPMPVRRPNVKKRNSMQVANPLSPMPKAQRMDPAKVTFRQLYLKRKM